MKRNKRYLPAEWHTQSGVQLTWPHEDTDWNYMLPEVRECFAAIAGEIARRELLLIVTPDPAEVISQLAGRVDMNNVRFLACETNDTWARDHGGITVIDDDTPTVLDFTFNGWGLKYAANRDNLITGIAAKNKMFNAGYENRLGFVLEGGAIESDGTGTLLTTSACLLSANRNGHLGKEQIEDCLKTTFNAERVLWLNHGYLAGDDTDSHVDTLARFCSPGAIAYVRCDDRRDEHYEELKQMEEQLKTFRTGTGKPYNLLPLPMPGKIEADGERLPATYANFLIVNGAVLYPTYDQPANDQMAKETLAAAFPGRETVGINCLPLIRQHGSLHCVTMQYPEHVIR